MSKKSVNLEKKSVRVRHMNGGSSKINRPTSKAFGRVLKKPSNKINKALTEVQVKTPPRLDEINHDMVKIGLISAGMVSAFLVESLRSPGPFGVSSPVLLKALTNEYGNSHFEKPYILTEKADH